MPIYKVIAPAGETLYAIGKLVLPDDPDGWMKIRQLNPQVNPEQPVAAGTLLAMPANAAVPPGNR